MSAGAAARPPWRGLLVVGLGASIAPLDFAVNVAFPAIADAFALPTHAIRWVAVCYVLTYGSLMLGFGALGDRIGHLRVFRAGLVLGAAAFVLCALAPTYPALLAARVVQGVSAALVLSCAPALATLLVDEARRTWALSAFAATQSIAGVVAPLIGGAAIAALDWPGVYLFRVPVALLALAGLPWIHAALRGRTPRAPAPFDAAGSALLAAAVALLLLGPSLPGPGSSPWPALPVTLAGVLAMRAFVRRQRRADAPFLPPAVARDGAFRVLNAGACVLQFACFAVPLTVPYYLLRGGWSPEAAGALLCTWAVGTLGGSAAAARVVATIGAHRAAVAGATVAALGLAAVAAWPARAGPVAMLASLAVQGAGLGLFQVAYADAVVAALPASARGVAGSLTMVTRTVGLVVGVTTWMVLLQTVEEHGLAAGAAPREAFVAAFGTVFRVAAIAIAACVAGVAIAAARARAAAGR